MYNLRMEWLNYHHLLYFYTVARLGSVARAAVELRLAQPTISGQIRQLEGVLEERLFQRAGRGLALTDMGRIVLGYAEEIFGLGRELLDVVKGRPSGRPLRLVVGIADVVPKFVAWRLLQPALGMAEPVRLVCREGKSERLFAELSIQELDLVLSDAPLPPAARVKAYSHLLAESAVEFFAVPELAARYRKNFPASLDGAPVFLPTEATSLRRGLDQWFEELGVRPRIVAEFDDSALLKTFGQAGGGLFPAPAVIGAEIQRLYGVRAVGVVGSESVHERFYAISVERRLKHPAVLLISQVARRLPVGALLTQPNPSAGRTAGAPRPRTTSPSGDPAGTRSGKPPAPKSPGQKGPERRKSVRSVGKSNRRGT